MKRSKFTESQIVFALQQAETGVAVAEVCRKLGISEATFYSTSRSIFCLSSSLLIVFIIIISLPSRREAPVFRY